MSLTDNLVKHNNYDVNFYPSTLLHVGKISSYVEAKDCFFYFNGELSSVKTKD